MNITAFLYAGQGSQTIGMGRDLYEAYPEFRGVVDGAEEQLSFPLRQIMWEGPEALLTRTEFTQPCMAVFAAGVTEILKSRGVLPDAAAGLSLGEYGALYAAGVWDRETYLRTVAFRGRVMGEAAEGLSACMSAVLGLSAEDTERAVEKACSQTGGFVTIANYNCPGQYVICGEERAVEAAESEAKRLGCRHVLRLKVGAPFHTATLQSAGEKLGDYLADLPMKRPGIPVAMNVTGRLLTEEEDLKTLLRDQISYSVQFEKDLEALLTLGADRFIEIGPGNVLAGFVKREASAAGRHPQIVSLSTAADLEKFLKEQASGTVREKEKK